MISVLNPTERISLGERGNSDKEQTPKMVTPKQKSYPTLAFVAVINYRPKSISFFGGSSV